MLLNSLFILAFFIVLPVIFASEPFPEEFSLKSEEVELAEKMGENCKIENACKSDLGEHTNVLDLDIQDHEASTVGFDSESDYSYSGDSDEGVDSDD